MRTSAPTRKGRQRPARTGRTSRPQMQTEPKLPFPEQHQSQPGLVSKLQPAPRWQASRYRAAGKLEGRIALITGGDSGIGRAVAFLFAREGADVAINYLPEEESDAAEVKRSIESLGRRCLTLPGDLTRPQTCAQIVEKTVKELGGLDILVPNAAHQTRKKSVADVTDEELDRTFKTNVYSYFRLVRAALPHLKPGAAIVATSSETGIFGSQQLPDYSAT